MSGWAYARAYCRMGGGLRSGFRAGRASMVPGMPGMLRERLQQLRVLDDRVPRRVGLPDGETGRFVATLAIKPRLVDQLRQSLGEEKIGRASRRERVCQDVKASGGAVLLK